MAIVTGKDAQIRIQGSSVPFEDELLINKSNKIYTIADPNKRLLNRAISLSFYPELDVDDTFRVDWSNGKIIFDKAEDRGELLVTGEYLNTTVVAKVKGFSLNTSMEFEDTTCLNELSSSKEPVGHTTKGTLDTLYVGNDFFIKKIQNKEPVVLEYTLGNITNSLTVYIDTAKLDFDPKGLVKYNVSFIEVSN